MSTHILILGAGFGGLDGPSSEFRLDKENFEKVRIAKWFK